MFKSRELTLKALVSKVPESTNPSKNLIISPLAQASVGEVHLKPFCAAIQEAHEVIVLSSALPGQEEHAEVVDAARKEVNSFIFGKIQGLAKVEEPLLLKLLTLGIKAQHKGNCAEFAFYTHSLLAKRDLPNEIFRIKGVGKNDSHVFLVANRNPLTPANDPTQWNKEALVVDPFLGKIYMAAEIEEQLQSCYHDEENNSVIYIPFDPEVHKLDNQVKQEFVEDWQGAVEQLSQDMRLQN